MAAPENDDDLGDAVDLPDALSLTYDDEADAAYLTLFDDLGPGSIARTIEVPPTPRGAQFLLSVDVEGRLVGIEILGASQGLTPAALAHAVPTPG